jgi:hypothetical protein
MHSSSSSGRQAGSNTIDVLDVGECPYFSAVPNHRHVLRSRVSNLCLFLDISDITDMPWTFLFLDSGVLCLLWVVESQIPNHCMD